MRDLHSNRENEVRDPAGATFAKKMSLPAVWVQYDKNDYQGLSDTLLNDQRRHLSRVQGSRKGRVDHVA